METDFNYTAKGEGWFSSDEAKWINRIHKLKQQFPELVEIIKEPEDNDGCIYCRLPADWLKINPPRGLSMTEEQKMNLAARFQRSESVQLQDEN